MRNKKEVVIEALKELEQAFTRCQEVFNDFDIDDNINNYIVDEYPFHLSFDEIDVAGWVESSVEKLENAIEKE